MTRIQLLLWGGFIVFITMFLSVYVNLSRGLLDSAKQDTNKLRMDMTVLKTEVQLLSLRLQSFASGNTKENDPLYTSWKDYSLKMDKILQQFSSGNRENRDNSCHQYIAIIDEIKRSFDAMNSNINSFTQTEGLLNIPRLVDTRGDTLISVKPGDLNVTSVIPPSVPGNTSSVKAGLPQPQTDLPQQPQAGLSQQTQAGLPQQPQAGLLQQAQAGLTQQSLPQQQQGGPKEKKRLVIGILASYAHFDRREGIRQTWTQYLKGTNLENAWTYKFFLGLPTNSSQWPEVMEEQKKYGDIEFVPYLDNYRNLTYKTMSIARWAVDNYDFEYMMKIDDDSFLRLDWLMTELEKMAKIKIYTGISVGKFRPDRNPKSVWYTSRELWPSNTGPVVITGPGYVLSYDCASHLAKRSTDPTLVVLPLEDVNTAVIMSEIGVAGQPWARFRPGSCPCRANMILSHWCGPDQFRKYYRNSLTDSKEMCRK